MFQIAFQKQQVFLVIIHDRSIQIVLKLWNHTTWTFQLCYRFVCLCMSMLLRPYVLFCMCRVMCCSVCLFADGPVTSPGLTGAPSCKRAACVTTGQATLASYYSVARGTDRRVHFWDTYLLLSPPLPRQCRHSSLRFSFCTWADAWCSLLTEASSFR